MWSFLHSIYVGSLGLLNPDVYFLLWAWGIGGIISLSKLPVPLGGVRAQEWCWVQGEHAPGLRGVSGASSGGHMLHSRETQQHASVVSGSRSTLAKSGISQGTKSCVLSGWGAGSLVMKAPGHPGELTRQGSSPH